MTQSAQTELVEGIKLRLAQLPHLDLTASMYLAASMIISYFLGDRFSERYIKPGTTPDPYMMNSITNSTPEENLMHQDRVVALADYLFSLQKERGFDVLVQRFTTNRDMRSVNLEAMVACHYKKNNFSVEVLPSSGIRGRDFDFKAFDKSGKLNVEVTGCKKATYGASTVRNILHKKKDQLPLSSGPGFLYCILPQDWLQQNPNLVSDVSNVTREFYARSKPRRINAVVFLISQLIRMGSGAAFLIEQFLVANQHAQFPFDLSLLTKEPAVAPEVRNIIATMNPNQTPDTWLKNCSYWGLVSER
jgi:hypothetical protein